MKAPKNLEAVFVVASILSGFAVYATAEVPVTRLAPVAQVATAAAPQVSADTNVVIIKAKRLTAAEKAALN